MKDYQKARQRKKKIRRAIRKVNLMLGIPLTEQDVRGFSAEDRGFLIATYLKKKKLIRGVKEPSHHFSLEDLEKKDLILTQLDGTMLPIDVKTYWNETEERKCRRAQVDLLPIGPNEKIEWTRERMLGLVTLALMRGLSMEQTREVLSFICQKKERRRKRKSLLQRIFTR